MARTHDESSTGGSRESRSAKGRGRVSPERDTVSGPGNAIESSSLRPIELPQSAPVQPPSPAPVSPITPTEHQSADRREEISRAAYYRAEQRGFAPGFELDDWLEAERALLEKEGGADLR